MDSNEGTVSQNKQEQDPNYADEEQRQSPSANLSSIISNDHSNVGSSSAAGINIFTQSNDKPLDVETVADVLKNVHNYEAFASHSFPLTVEAGKVFLFSPKKEDEQGSHRKDQFMWINHGPKAIPAKDPVIQKRYYVAKLPDGRSSKFHKCVYTLLNDIRSLKPCIVQYLGSMDGITVSSKKSRIQAEKNSKDLPGSTQMNGKVPEKRPKLLNITRPVHIQHKKLAIGKDDAKLLHEFAYNFPAFVHYIQLVPSFQCIFGLKDISDHLELIIQNTSNPILFSYSHSYEIGEFIVSSFMFSHVGFDGQPSVPSHFIIHEKDDKFAHQELFRILKEMVPSITSIRSPILTEGNQHKDEAIAKSGFNLVPISSWKEIIVHVKEWMYTNKANQQEVATAIDDIRKLMSSESLEIYNRNLEKCKENWGPALQEYYISNVDDLVKTKHGRWHLEEFGVFNPYTGVVDKQNDNLETVMHHLQSWNKSSVNAIAIACYLMQHFIRKEIRDGSNGIGRFIAKVEINAYKNSMSNWKPIPFLCLPENVVHYIKEDQLVVQDGAVIEKTEGDAKKTLLDKGKQIYENGNIHHSTSHQAFFVKDDERHTNSYIVKLYPRATCTCDSTMFCQHIIAVKISIGVDMQSEMERLDMKFVSRALKSCENAAEGIKTRRRRRKRPITETHNFDPSNKRDCMIGQKTETTSDGDDDSDDENEVTRQDNSQVGFFSQSGEQPSYFP